MSRRAIAIAAIIALVVMVGYYLVLFSPKQDEIAALEEQIVSTRTQQTKAQSDIASRKAIRERAPEIEATLGALDALTPREVGLPSALRQLQVAADESGVVLVTIAPGRPSASGGGHEMSLSLQLTGGYFQIVDFLRRIEDPEITPRAMLWTTASISPGTYPNLTASLSGSMFSVLEGPAVADAPAEGDAS